ncbi:penicillin-binding protein 2 [uncultured Limosilactobacillus sp.]|uniref:peptidoglycan D,D-transpeptidase FtsI family protein n=1 Tax=uncultured Limosilactobacillus sp. TaxID=2837629 RepID=UPI0025E7794C|nr:penicillin-binding protein 2 [uncultured Limosilactobacillus sp.]
MNFLNRFKGLFKFRSRSRNKTAQSAIPFRLTFLLWIVGVLLLALAVRLFYLQVLNGASYKAEVKRSDTTTQTNNVQRGMIYDATGKVMVGNQATQAITYTKGQNVSSDDLYKIANRLGNYLSVPTKRLTTRNQQDYYLADNHHLKTVLKLAKSSDSSNQYDDAIEYLNNHPHYFKLTKEQKNKAMIYGTMSGAYSLSTTYIKSKNVSPKELAEVSEHLSEMPGVKVGTAWSRNYPSGKDVKSLAGTVSTTGLPSDEVNSLLSQGYSRNDNVGQSYLEKQYQATLAGSKSQTQVTTSGHNVTKTKVTYPGKKGDNLVLTVNAKFQNEVQKILKSSFPAGGNSTGVYAVVMNPYTGAIYAMGGIDRDPSTGKMTDDQIGAINHPITMGSVVKPATIMGGLMEKVITPENNTFTDTPIKVAGTSVKSSWFNKSGSASMSLTAPEALEVSSNSYMMQIAMKEGGMNYHSGTQLTLKPSIFQKMRYYYNMFGLGQKTGIDLPGEVSGYQGPSKKKNIGSALDLSYGNYDGYTTIQLAQYMSTIANGGYRMKPYIVKEIRGTKANGQLGNITYTAQPQVQQVIPAPKSYFDLVRRGLYLVTHGTNSYTTAKSLSSVKPSISAKTGTAETFYKKQSTETLSFAGYAPSDKPQVVVALAIANASGGENNLTMAKQIFQAYWKTVQSDKSAQ